MEKRNIKLEIMYDGTNYHGFQRQKNGITIQECLENAIEKITGEVVTVYGCGRTDAGVHALCYTANFKTSTLISAEKLPFALNSQLNEDIRVFSAEDVPCDFHSRYCAVSKTYTYKIVNRPFMDVFLSRYSWFYPQKLDIEKMKKAAEHIVGKHDFAAFMAAGSPVSSTIREVKELKVSESDGVIDIEITADGFLYNMVRIITGTLVYAGCGKILPDDLPDIILSKDRVRAGVTAPPQGLKLKKSIYKEGQDGRSNKIKTKTE